jgi:predicted transcriptional regulator
MTKAAATDDLSRRERQVMEILYRRGEATVSEILDDLPDPPTYSAVRSILRILGTKRLITFKAEGARYIYRAATPVNRAGDEVLEQVVRTYFAGSAEQAVTALLRIADADLSDADVSKLRASIRTARQKGR